MDGQKTVLSEESPTGSLQYDAIHVDKTVKVKMIVFFTFTYK